MTTIIWHGTTEEYRELLRLAKKACHEDTETDCLKGQRCAVHTMMVTQDTLDRLLFARRIRDRLQAEEHLPR